MTSFFNKNWQYRVDEGQGNLYDILLKTRKLKKHKNLQEFINPKFKHLSNPYEFPEMQKAVNRIFDAIKKNEKIVIFGDFDLDGITGTAILFKTIKALNSNVTAWLPTRHDGFGLSKKYIDAAIQNKINLFITVDCGIANYNHIQDLQKNGTEVIVTDHHTIPKKIPKAIAILHPKYPKENETDFTGAGIAFKLAHALILESSKLSKQNNNRNFDQNKTNEFLNNLLELAAMGTIADLGELINENRTIVALGLDSLKKTSNHGIKSLMQSAKIAPHEINVEKIAFFLAPRLNAAGRIDHPIHSLELLLGNTEKAPKLELLNLERQNMTEKYLEEILKNIDDTQPALIYKNNQFHPGIIGLLAGKLAEKYNKPAIALTENNERCFASCRGPEDFHFANALTELSELLLGHGGHAQAAGFSLIKENFDNFKKTFINFVASKRGSTPPAPSLAIDAKIPKELLNIQNVSKLHELAPFGAGFTNPVFSIKNPQITNLKRVGKKENHLSVQIDGINAIGFFCAEMDTLLSQSKDIEIAFTPELREWNGKKSVQIKIADARKLL